jgi:hypothetical protein
MRRNRLSTVIVPKDLLNHIEELLEVLLHFLFLRKRYYFRWVWLFYIIANLFVFKAYKQIIINKIIAI